MGTPSKCIVPPKRVPTPSHPKNTIPTSYNTSPCMPDIAFSVVHQILLDQDDRTSLLAMARSSRFLRDLILPKMYRHMVLRYKQSWLQLYRISPVYKELIETIVVHPEDSTELDDPSGILPVVTPPRCDAFLRFASLCPNLRSIDAESVHMVWGTAHGKVNLNNLQTLKINAPAVGHSYLSAPGSPSFFHKLRNYRRFLKDDEIIFEGAPTLGFFDRPVKRLESLGYKLKWVWGLFFPECPKLKEFCLEVDRRSTDKIQLPFWGLSSSLEKVDVTMEVQEELLCSDGRRALGKKIGERLGVVHLNCSVADVGGLASEIRYQTRQKPFLGAIQQLVEAYNPEELHILIKRCTFQPPLGPGRTQLDDREVSKSTLPTGVSVFPITIGVETAYKRFLIKDPEHLPRKLKAMSFTVEDTAEDMENHPRLFKWEAKIQEVEGRRQIVYSQIKSLDFFVDADEERTKGDVGEMLGENEWMITTPPMWID